MAHSLRTTESVAKILLCYDAQTSHAARLGHVLAYPCAKFQPIFEPTHLIEIYKHDFSMQYESTTKLQHLSCCYIITFSTRFPLFHTHSHRSNI